MHLGRHYKLYVYNMSAQKIQLTRSDKDLGVTITVIIKYGINEYNHALKLIKCCTYLKEPYLTQILYF